MANASLNLTIDLAAFQKSLTSAFSMYQATLRAMGQESPKMMSDLTAELDKFVAKASKPVPLTADGKEFSSEVDAAKGKLENLDRQSEKSRGALTSWWDANKQTLSQFSLVYSGVMAVYNDVTRVFASFINEATEAERASARVTAAVRSTGRAAGYTAEELKGMAAGLEAAFAIDADKMISEVTTPLLTFTQISGEVFRGAQEAIINISRALGTDLQSSAMQVGKALNDPIRGVAALREVGVSFSQDQEEVIRKLVETGEAAEAQKLILKELSVEFGGQAEEYAGTRAQQLDRLTVSFSNLKEVIGGGLMPAIAGLSGVLSPVFDLMGSFIGRLTGQKSALDNAKQGIIGQRVEFERLVLIYSDLHREQNRTTEQQERYQGVIKDLMDKYPNYLGNIDLEKGKWREISTAILNARTQLQSYINLKIQEAIVKDMEDQIVKVSSKIVEAESKLYTLRAEFEAGVKSSLTTVQKVADPLSGGGQGAGGTETVLSKWGREELKLEGQVKSLTQKQEDLNEVMRQRLEIAQKIYAVPPTNAPESGGGGGSAGSGGSGGATDQAGTEAETQMKEAERVIAELAKLRQSETEQLEAEYTRRLGLIQAYLASGSAEEKAAIEDLEMWKTAKEAEIAEREKAGIQAKFKAEVQHLANLRELGVSGYEQLKAKMEEYYEWAKVNLPEEEAALVQKQLQESNLRWGVAQKEKEEKERAHQRALEDIRQEYRDRDLSEDEQALNDKLVALERYFEDNKQKLIEAGLTELDIAKWIAEEKERITGESEKKIAETKESRLAGSLSKTSSILRTFGDVQNRESKRGFKTWKAMAISQAIVDMAASVLGAFRSQIGIPFLGPILAAAQAAAAMAFGAKQISEIQNTKFEPEQAATGGLLVGNSHSNGGIMIEAEGGEFITRKQRVRELGKGVFDFINNGPIDVVRQMFAGMAIPAMEASSISGSGYVYAGGGSVGANGLLGIMEAINEKMGVLVDKNVKFDIHIDPLANDPVKVSEIADTGKIMRSEV